jgi:hypothetical protein
MAKGIFRQRKKGGDASSAGIHRGFVGIHRSFERIEL